MGTKNTVSLISTIDGSTTTYYLSGGGASQTPYAGSGTPWTAESTTPYELSLNDVTGSIWVPQPTPRQVIYTGSPPFRDGRSPLYAGYGNMQEEVGIQLRAASGGGATAKDNAIFLLRQLRRILNSAMYAVPCVLAVKGGTNTTYYEVYSADVPEQPTYLSEPDGFFRATITWTRSAHGGLLSAGETLLNAVTIENRGTSSPDNVEAYAAGSGDLVYEGQPLNLVWTAGQAGTYSKLWAASIYSRVYSTSGAGSLTTNSTTGADATLASFDVTPVLFRQALKPRIMIHATCASNAQYKILVYFGGATKQLVYISPQWIQTTATVSTLVDTGYFSLATVRFYTGIASPSLNVVLRYRSTNGSNATVTLTSSQYLLYYDFCIIGSSGAVTLTNTDSYLFDCFPVQSNIAALPYWPGRVLVTHDSVATASVDYRGVLPRYWYGSSLWLAWLDSGAYTTTQTATVTAAQAPLFRTVRGNS